MLAGVAPYRGQALAAQPSPAWPEAAVSAHSGYGRSADADDPRSDHKAKLAGRSTWNPGVCLLATDPILIGPVASATASTISSQVISLRRNRGGEGGKLHGVSEIG